MADFRKDNIKPFKPIFGERVLLSGEQALFGGELIAIDGSKSKAVNGKPRNLTKGKLKEKLEEIEAKIER
ncbi:MAG: hypothetical protein GTN74_08735 [Proteobacteria bacterium]|nr:hypothetical protein [Pseudomonadota bacterium]NIS70006.1 hypothetical protein [Pseudomonadota bacterium]